MSPYLAVDVPAQLRFPRVSGDEPVTVFALTDPRSFSPRERG